MRIKSIRVQNFRSVRDETLPCEPLTALVGPNGSGKSSFLRALDMFYTLNANYTENDFFNRDTSQDIIITVTFTDLMTEEKKRFQRYLEGENLTVSKIISWPQSKVGQRYYGMHLQNPDFDTFRSANGPDMRKEYMKLLEGEYPDLPPYTNKEEAEKALQAWEESHLERCIHKRDDGQFFGFREVGKARLERYTQFILIPAVRDASDDAIERKGAPLTEIMDLVVRSVLSQQKDLTEFQETTQKKFREIVGTICLSELKTLEKDLSETLKAYVPDAGVELEWDMGDVVKISPPEASIRLVEDEYPSTVERTGHGLQRAFIMAMLQRLAAVRSSAQEETEYSQEMSNLIIGIEEPELYQHPNRQRHFCKVLLGLAEGRIQGVAKSIQVIYTTHSPLFVDIKLFNSVRRLRKLQEEARKPKQTKIFYTTLEEVAQSIEKVDGGPGGTYTSETLGPRLRTLMTPWMNEGFFADVAVLVEGEEDRAAILGVAAAMRHDLESMGISVIPCMSKNNLDRPTVIFRKLGVPVYTIWDSDYGDDERKPEENHRLLRLFGRSCENWPEKIAEDFACFKKTLGKTLRSEIGEDLYDSILHSVCDDFCISRKRDAAKNPHVMQEIITEAYKKGKSSKTLERIVMKIIDLKR